MVSLQSSTVAPNNTLSTEDDFNITSTHATILKKQETTDNSALLDFVVIPLTIIVAVGIIVALVAFIVRKKRLDKLRHHLMPLYSFDPVEDGEDWEAELLEEGLDHAQRAKSSKPSEQPQLAFRSNL